MEKIAIISQNMNGQTHKVKEYMRNYKADIYAFQEIRKSGRTLSVGFEFNDTNSKKQYTKNESSEKARMIWEKAFPWIEFKSGYWIEKCIDFAGEKIVIINFHCSPSYVVQLRYTLLQRLDAEDIRDSNVILLGDFNAAFAYQTEKKIPENHSFLSLIIKKKYIELTEKGEDDNNPHYTFSYKHKKDGWKRKKLDHIFVSSKVFRMCQNGIWEMEIEYIDNVNRNIRRTPESFSDHSGVKLTIRTLDN